MIAFYAEAADSTVWCTVAANIDEACRDFEAAPAPKPMKYIPAVSRDGYVDRQRAHRADVIPDAPVNVRGIKILLPIQRHFARAECRPVAELPRP